MSLEELQKLFQDMAVSTGHHANEKMTAFSALLMQIAFASVGLAVVYLETDERPYACLVVIGTLLLVLSIVFGGVQMILDYQFFREDYKILQRLNHTFVKFLIQDQNGLDANKTALSGISNEMKNRPDESTKYPTHLQVLCMGLGSIFVLIAFLNAL